MNFSQAYVAMLAGRKVKASSWIEGDFIYIKDNQILCDGKFAFAGMLKEADINDDWVIVS